MTRELPCIEIRRRAVVVLSTAALLTLVAACISEDTASEPAAGPEGREAGERTEAWTDTRNADAGGSYAELVKLFHDWREFEKPPLLEGAPDYSAERLAAMHAELPEYQARLQAMDIDDWPIEQQVDWHVVRAEMNGFDFNYRVLQPWVRDPAFYQSIWTYRSDVPAHEGPTHHAVLELWTYEFPLSASEERRMIAELQVIPPLMRQARRNLTGDARDLWITGIRNIDAQRRHLDTIADTVGEAAGEALVDALAAAALATDELAAWLRRQVPEKTGPSGIGKENYSWYQQNVRLVPLTWEDEVRLLERELDRAWSSLKLEEHRNRELPPLVAVSTPEEYDRLANDSADRLMAFLEEEQILTVKDYLGPALREHLETFVPEEERDFFWITSHLDPTPLYTHYYHWFDLAQMDAAPHPSPIRRGPLLYNIFDSRSEGVATGVEEMFMHAGLYDDHPRSRELVWILLAQRAARGLGSLYAHANEMTMEEAGRIHVEWTPRGWMATEKELLIFEQHLFLRQPGYGTSYVTGKYQLERTLADYAKLKEERAEDFTLREFFDELNAVGIVPMALVRWQMTGLDDEVRRLTGARPSR